MKKFTILLSVIIVLSACKKTVYYPNNSSSNIDITNEGAGLYLPVYVGSSWVYNHYQFFGHQPVKIGIQTCRYDSIPNYFFNYDNNNKFLSYGYWYRDNINDFLAGGGQLLFTNRYIDSLKGKAFTLDKGNNVSFTIYGGLDTLQTKFGKVSCIKTSGKGGNAGALRWVRHFGYGIGVMRYEEYYMNKTDTTSHYLLELDSFKINR